MAKTKSQFRIKKYYRYGRFPFYSIQKINGDCYNVALDLIDDNLKLAKKIKKFLQETNE